MWKDYVSEEGKLRPLEREKNNNLNCSFDAYMFLVILICTVGSCYFVYLTLSHPEALP